ncbi:MAG TPA: hypothetical protein VF552_16100, partial [Allosphingosinicella sp.]
MAMRVLFRLLLALAGLSLVPAAAHAAHAAPDRLAEALALPVASNLAGARDVPRFAWVENEAGVRNIWTAMRGEPARCLTMFDEDDGQLLYGLALSGDGTALAYV